ncbi:MAG: Bcr/CflA family drug resistance efflux transporter [Rhodospirillaceae bacterium]|nr:Bcr/CflA family drug resistance efflux transporter [Rhodospirillaceae bacterium]
MGRFSPGVLIILGALAALGAAAIDMYLPALPSIERELGAQLGKSQHTLSAFFIGLGIGQLFYGSLSDAFGRRRTLMAGIVVYCAASFLCSFADNMVELIWARFLQALGAASGGVIARAMVRDVFTLDKAAQAQSIINLAFSITPLIAPSIGGWLLIWFGWRAIFFALSGFGVVCLIALYLKVPETLRVEKRNRLSFRAIFHGYWMIARNRRSVGCILTGAFAFSCMFTYFAASPFIFIELFGIPDEYYGLLFGVNVLGIIGANIVNARNVVKQGPILMLRIGISILSFGSIALFLSIFFTQGGILGILIPLFFIVGSLGFVGANAIALALDPFPDLAGTTASLFGFVQMMLGAVAGVVVGFMHDGTVLPMGIIVLVFSLFSASSLIYFVRD